MGNVFLFGAGASCEYRGVYGGLFIDGTFFQALEEMWARWLRGGKGLVLQPWDPKSPVYPGGAQHYDGDRWRLPDLQAVLERICGPDYRDRGLETTFSRVAEEGTPEELDLYIRAIELTIFHKVRALNEENVEVHLRFLRHQLRPSDAIVTFNYDPIIEIALRILSTERLIYWHEADGYRLELRELGGTSDPPIGPSSVELLKLHGSLNWLAPAGRPSRPPFRLLRITPNSLRGVGQVVHTDQEGHVVRPVIVPPRPDKNYDEVGLTPLWKRTDDALAAATSLTVVGYRLPDTDVAARDLLTRAAEHMKAGTPVTYVTRDAGDAARRFAEVFPNAEIKVGGFRAYSDRLVST